MMAGVGAANNGSAGSELVSSLMLLKGRLSLSAAADGGSGNLWGLLLFSILSGWLLLAFAKSRLGLGGKEYKLPPGPRGWPVVGSLITILLTGNGLPHRAMVKLAKTWGPVMLLKLGRVRAIYISDAEVARQVFKEHDKVISSRPTKIAAFKYLTYGPLHIAQAPYGSYWQHMKKLLVLELLTAKRIQQFKHVRTEELAVLVKRVTEAAKSKSAIDMHQALAEHSLAAMSRLAVGSSILERDLSADETLAPGERPRMGWLDTVNGMLLLFGTVAVEDFLPPLGFVDVLTGLRGHMRRLKTSIDIHLQHIVDQHKRRLQEAKDQGQEQPEARDLMDVLLMSPDKPPGDGCVKAVALEAMTAGAESSSVSLEWALSELVDNQDCLRRAQAEIDALVGRDRMIEEAETGPAQLPYLHACVKESMRRHVPFPMLVPRETTEDCTIGGYDVPAGSMIIFQAWGIAHDEKQWKDPTAYNPDRFMDSPIDIEGQHMEVMPFGSGRRSCPGMNLALTSLHSALARLIHSFDWSLPDGVQRLDMMERYAVSTPRRSGLVAVPTPRLPAHLYTC